MRVALPSLGYETGLMVFVVSRSALYFAVPDLDFRCGVDAFRDFGVSDGLCEFAIARSWSMCGVPQV